LKLPAKCLFLDKTNKIGKWKKVLISSYDKVTEQFNKQIIFKKR